MVDFLFVYEVKNRELENICLIKSELEKRGYSVKLVETWKRLHYYVKPIKAKVVIGHAGYDNGTVQFCLSYSKGCKKYVDMQWEQVFSVYEEEKTDSAHSFSGVGTKVSHICWGDYSFNRLRDQNKIDEKLLPVTGHISFDFLKPKFKGYYLSKEDILKQYNLPNQPLYLFISGFNLVDMPLSQFEGYDLGYDPKEMQDFNAKSQKLILKWFEKALVKYPNVSIVYRPHPAEYGSALLKEMTDKYPNFHVIRDYSIKQWIAISDKIYTWNSTSVAEIYSSNRPCSIIRPLPIPVKNDIRLFIDCDKITDEDSFLNDYLNTNNKFPVDEELLKKYYLFDSSFTYKRIADALVKIYNCDDYNVDFSEYLPKAKFTLKGWFISKIYGIYWRTLTKCYQNNNRLIMPIINKRTKIKNKIEKDHLYYSRMIKNNYSSNKEIKNIQEKINKYI